MKTQIEKTKVNAIKLTRETPFGDSSDLLIGINTGPEFFVNVNGEIMVYTENEMKEIYLLHNKEITTIMKTMWRS